MITLTKGYLPVLVEPFDDETFESWWYRVCIKNAITSAEFRALIRGENSRSDSDPQKTRKRLSDKHLERLSTITRVALEKIDPFYGYVPKPDPLAHRKALPQVYESETDGLNLFKSTTYFCPLCLQEDPIPYYRANWNEVFFTICPKHKCFLSPPCRSQQHELRHRNYVELAAQHRQWKGVHHCRECGFDLRKTTPIFPTVKQGEFLIPWQSFLCGETYVLPPLFAWGSERWLQNIDAELQLKFAYWCAKNLVYGCKGLARSGIVPTIKLKYDFQHTSVTENNEMPNRMNFIFALASVMHQLETDPTMVRRQIPNDQQVFLRSLAYSQELMLFNPLIRLVCFGFYYNDSYELKYRDRASVYWWTVRHDLQAERRKWQRTPGTRWFRYQSRFEDPLISKSWSRIIEFNLLHLAENLQAAKSWTQSF